MLESEKCGFVYDHMAEDWEVIDYYREDPAGPMKGILWALFLMASFSTAGFLIYRIVGRLLNV